MNAWINGPAASLSDRFPAPGAITILLLRNSPTCGCRAEVFVLIDENPGSINDAFFYEKPGQPTWCDVPATYHNNAGGLSFADGHAQIKKWSDPAILGNKIYNTQAMGYSEPTGLMVAGI